MNIWFFWIISGLFMAVAIYAFTLAICFYDPGHKFVMFVLGLIASGLGIFVMVTAPASIRHAKQVNSQYYRLNRQYRDAINEMKANTHDQVRYNYWNAQAHYLKYELDKNYR